MHDKETKFLSSQLYRERQSPKAISTHLFSSAGGFLNLLHEPLVVFLSFHHLLPPLHCLSPPRVLRRKRAAIITEVPQLKKKSQQLCTLKIINNSETSFSSMQYLYGLEKLLFYYPFSCPPALSFALISLSLSVYSSSSTSVPGKTCFFKNSPKNYDVI